MDLVPGFRQKLKNFTSSSVSEKPLNFMNNMSLFQENSSPENIDYSDNIVFIRSTSAIFSNLTHSALQSVAMGVKSNKNEDDNENYNLSRQYEAILKTRKLIINADGSNDNIKVSEESNNSTSNVSIICLLVQSLFGAYCDMKKIENNNKSGLENGENNGQDGRDVDGQDKGDESGSPMSHSTESGRLVQSAGCSIVLLAFAEANQGDESKRVTGGSVGGRTAGGGSTGGGGVGAGGAGGGRGSVNKESVKRISVHSSYASVTLTDAVLEITHALQSESSTSLRSEVVFLKRICAANLLTVLVQNLLCHFSSSSSSSSSSSPSTPVPPSISLSAAHQTVDGLGLLLRTYELFLAAALYGMGDFEPYVRVQCGTVLRMLVPLAPIARERTIKPAPYVPLSTVNEVVCSAEEGTEGKPWKQSGIRFTMTQEEKMSKLIESLLSRKPLQRITESTDPLDVFLINELASKTHLLPILNRLNKPYKKILAPKGFENIPCKKVSVRPYQWDGVSWLLQLYRCGLGGVLAGNTVYYYNRKLV